MCNSGLRIKVYWGLKHLSEKVELASHATKDPEKGARQAAVSQLPPQATALLEAWDNYQLDSIFSGRTSMKIQVEKLKFTLQNV